MANRHDSSTSSRNMQDDSMESQNKSTSTHSFESGSHMDKSSGQSGSHGSTGSDVHTGSNSRSSIGNRHE